LAKRSPILGFNHNIRHRGVVFHVQTEDSGVDNPHLFTHLFHGGTILSTRKLVPESLKVYPIQDNGAIEVGTHTFYAVKSGAPDRLTETGQFTHYWKQEHGQWKLSRVLSYDHVLAK
jgi:hypothetical protein